ncbi:hypothetical protein AJ80_07381 [Polytolypa hystricis UAMH7299]|uniref:Enoyl reductase (ER) domain-containing protein n=1 Tax=Polytolypa hystricis (strain UAMH7299) TaxID=1447883 RepID=A0A2B7XPF7_POLH7|nr:hypothetical protein AJ80_07381 [Polytolypa hystricis UAMH7299]
MSRTTTAIVLNKLKGVWELREVSLAAIRPDEALVEIHASGICHTDLSCASGILPCTAPAVLGHEGAGVVLETGSAITHVSAGDKVLLSFSYCNACKPCLAGHPAYCYDFNNWNFGGSRPDGSSAMFINNKDGEDELDNNNKKQQTRVHSSFFGQSSFARHTLVHKTSLVKIPAASADTPLALLAPLGCGIQTGAGAVLNTLNASAGSTIAVFGVGSVGLSAVMAAKMRGAATIIAIDLHSSRLELAKRLGATHAILGSDKDVKDQIRTLCPPIGVDFAVDCTGVPAVVESMIESLGACGRAATVGTPGPGKFAKVEINSLLVHGREYVGCVEGDCIPEKFIPYLLEQYAKGELPLEEIITYYPISEYKKAIEDSENGSVIKAVLKW